MKTNKEKASIILNRLKKRYGKELLIHLNYKNDYEFLFSVIMSAQCTDKQVNIVTKSLYLKYKSLKDFANANIYELEKEIKSTGFYHNKAKNIIYNAKIIIEEYNSKVPNDMNSLLKLKGVGRKTANVVLGMLFNKGGIAVDTHVSVISKRLGLTTTLDPLIAEEELTKIIPNKKDQTIINTHMIAFGREICKKNKPKCENCFLSDLCLK
ncbi:MAG: endonuclease III [Eubacteriales bacterium]|nr:endonuclease III [Eubacteriales bacterium]